MTKFRIIGAAVLSLVLAGPAMATTSGGSGMHRVHHKHYSRMIHTMPGQRMSAAYPCRWAESATPLTAAFNAGHR